MNQIQARPYLMINQIQHYAWGMRGEEAFIPRLLGIEAEADTPYAELWMGTHPKAPSAIVLDGSPVSLRDLVARYPRQILGRAVSGAFSGQLPFLFKVLSTAEALSIQAHPTMAQARILHSRDPEHYLNDNHKPELAIILDSLTALLGFRDLISIRQAMDRYPEMAGFVGQETLATLRASSTPSPAEERRVLQQVFAALIERSVSHEEALDAAIDRLASRLKEMPGTLNEKERLFLELRHKYRGPDVGLLCIFVLNLVHLRADQGVFIAAGMPHAYLKGNIVECMANSDNVVRAGLTPKYKDVETLLDILTYDTAPVPLLEGKPNLAEVVYRTPAPEFQVSRWRLGDGEERHVVTENGLQILLVTAGEITIRWQGGEATFRRGQSILIPALLQSYALAAAGRGEVFAAEVPPGAFE